ncbi:hypothetical protein [Rhodococcus artemisiae]|uniref:hypothetical protein n=1 Tax=Rhodococcus artemisiae TaxID=714159 RepID=UPI002E7BE2D0|nr:hypothetical protein [Rhodococcus artemisiae]
MLASDPHDQARRNPRLGRAPRAEQAGQLRRTATGKNRKKAVEVVYLISSADHVAALASGTGRLRAGTLGNRELAALRAVLTVRSLSQVRAGREPRIIATCRKLVVSLLRIAGWDNIAAGFRHHARHLERAVTLGLT